MKLYLLLPALAFVLLLAACNGNDGDGGDDDTPAADETPEATVESSPPPPAPTDCPKIDDEVVQSVVVLLVLDKTTYLVGEPVEMRMRLLNCASREITRFFTDEQRYDFVVTTEDDEEVWRWSNGMEFAQTEGEESYDPSSETIFEETWDQTNNNGEQVPAGSYQITARSTSCDETLMNCEISGLLSIEITAE